MWLVIIIRLLSPLLIFVNPLGGTFFAIYTDMLDWSFLRSINQFDPVTYQIVDKSLDFYYLLVLAIAVERWKKNPEKNIARFLFFWRGIGTLLFELTQKRELLILFPNFFDLFFIFYYAYPYFRKMKYRYTALNTFYIFLGMGVPKLIQEFLLHFNK